MVDRVDMDKGVIGNESTITAHSIDTASIDSINLTEETEYINERFTKDWGYFTRVAKLNSAIIMKAIWTVGKGYTTKDKLSESILENITGNGKQTFLEILFNLIVTKQAVRDSFAEIIRNDKGTLINLKILNPENMKIVFDNTGKIKRYEQSDASAKKAPIKFQPNEIFHLSHNNFGGSIHGTSVPETMEKTILADDQSFDIMKRLTTFQAVPFIIYKVKSDDTTTIANFKANLKTARTTGDDLIIPDDDNIISYEVVTVNPSSVLMEWRNSVNNQYYRELGLPLVLFGAAGSTESGSKMEVFGHETIFEHNQLDVENQIWNQLAIRLKLNSPDKLLGNLQQDESKDKQNALNLQPSDGTAGSGR